MRKVIIAALLTIVLVGSVVLLDHAFRAGKKGPSESTSRGPALYLPPDIELVEFSSGKSVKFKSFQGKLVLINFWASWCEACMAEMPSIEKLYERYRSEGLEVVAVNVDDDPRQVVPQIVKALSLKFPIYTDPKAALQPFFNVVAIPFSVVADRHQKILWSDSGERDWATPAVMDDFKKLLKKI
jgi:thiol-disulfide isomerase/thioredoxin